MLKKACNDTCVLKANPVFGAAASKNARIAVAVAIIAIAIVCHLWGQNQRSYIYLDGQLVSLESQTLPVSWGSAEIGSTGIAGSASYSGSTYTIAGSGADISGTADGFRFAYQRISGDITITARVVTQTNTNGLAKAGVMIRNSLDANAAHAFTAITPSYGLKYQYRQSSGGSSVMVSGPSGTAPYWVRLRRSGNTFVGFVSTNGTSWTLVDGQSITMPATAYVGLAVTAHNNAALSTVTFDNVSFSVLPIPWDSADIGSPVPAGSSTISGNTFMLSSAGGDISGTADAFRYTYQPVRGNITITARVVSLQNANSGAKAGVMIRNSLDANAAHAFTEISPGNGLGFIRRTTSGGSSAYTAGPSGNVPYWVRIERSGDWFHFFTSTDGTNWSITTSKSITMAASVYAGLALAAPNNSDLCTATFDNVTVTNSTPNISGISPTYALAGDPAFTLTVNGSGFVPGSIVQWNNSNRATIYVSETRLKASITAADIAVGNVATVRVYNPAPGGGPSLGKFFTAKGQPTCFNFSASQGFAGLDNRVINICGAPNSSIDIAYEFTPWNSTIPGPLTYAYNIGYTDYDGVMIWPVPQSTVPGTVVVKRIKNSSRSDWYDLAYPFSTYTIRPPKPTSFVLTPVTLYLPGQLSIYSNNSENQTIVEEYLNPNPPGGILQFPIPMNSSGQWSGPYACGFEPIGTYTIYKIRNQLDSGADAWTNLTNNTLTLVPCP